MTRYQFRKRCRCRIGPNQSLHLTRRAAEVARGHRLKRTVVQAE